MSIPVLSSPAMTEKNEEGGIRGVDTYNGSSFSFGIMILEFVWKLEIVICNFQKVPTF